MYFKIKNDIIHIPQDEILFVIKAQKDLEHQEHSTYTQHVIIILRNNKYIHAEVNNYTLHNYSSIFVDQQIWNQIKNTTDDLFNHIN